MLAHQGLKALHIGDLTRCRTVGGKALFLTRWYNGRIDINGQMRHTVGGNLLLDQYRVM